MEFNQLVSQKLVPVFLAHRFSILEESNNYFRFMSKDVEALISFNPQDQTCLFQIGQKFNTLYEIGDATIKDFLGSNIKLYGLAMQEFINNLLILLRTSLLNILDGDKIALNKLKKFKEKEAHEFTLEISQNRSKNEAEKAWLEKDYQKYIKILDQIGLSNLEPAYQKRYEFAQRNKFKN